MPTLSSLAVRLLAFLLIAEGMLAGVYVVELLPQIGIYDRLALALILARGLLGALQFTSGWMLASVRPQGVALAQVALVAGAALTILGVGLGLAPTSIYHWLRWQATAGYVVYALGAAAWLRSRRKTSNLPNSF